MGRHQNNQGVAAGNGACRNDAILFISRRYRDNWGFTGDGYAMRMAFTKASAGDAHEGRLFLEVLDVLAANIAMAAFRPPASW